MNEQEILGLVATIARQGIAIKHLETRLESALRDNEDLKELLKQEGEMGT